jgi:hypothetical protein
MTDLLFDDGSSARLMPAKEHAPTCDVGVTSAQSRRMVGLLRVDAKLRTKVALCERELVEKAAREVSNGIERCAAYLRLDVGSRCFAVDKDAEP